MSGLGGDGDSSALRFATTRGRTGNSSDFGLQYPSPFFDIGQTYLPATVKQMFRWCRYYFLVNPLINAVVSKMADYPITDIILDTEKQDLKDSWNEFLNEQLRYRPFQIEIGLDYFCLAGTTRVITRDGVFPIKNLAGKTVDVLSQGGVYRPATFKSHGFQQLWEVHTGQGTIYATKEHEWPVKTWSKQPSGVTSSSIVKRTTDRLAGKSVPRVVADRPPQNDLFWEGVRHGIVFGDGTLSNEGKQAHVILYTAEKRYLARYFEGYATITPHHEDKYLGVYGQSPAYKQLPESSSASYWYGFTCGLLSTDGSVDNRGQVILTQKDPNVLCAISERLPWLGLCGGQVREHWAWNSFTKQQEPMNYLSLFTQFMREQDFIRPDQKQRFLSCFVPTEYGKCVKVKKVVSTNRVEEVFCCVEPETHTFAIEDGVLTGNCYGNSLVSIFYPFVKMLRCTRCGFEKQASDAIYRFMNFEFHWQCEQCDHAGIAKVRDHYIKAPKGIRLLRWNPEDVDIKYNDISGEYEYYYSIPVQLKNDIIIGKKSAVESVPQLFIDALRLRKSIVFSRDNIYHFKRPTLAGKDRGWGIPLILPVLKDCYYLQILRKAQEAICLEHVVPLRVLFPQSGSASSDPFTTINLQDWHDQIASEIRRWRSDQNYIPILPLPIGQETIGGDGRALLLTQEIRVWSEHIVAGMGVPNEIIFGGLSYSGSNVSLRMLENMFLGYLSDQLSLLRWVIDKTASYLNWAKVGARFKPFKMADDLQRKAYLFQLNQAGKMSDESLLADADYDSAKEDKIMELEASRRVSAMKKQRLLQAEMEGEAMLVTAKWQNKAQAKAMVEQAAIQTEAAKEQMAFQSQMQNGMMQNQMAAQTGQPPPQQSPDLTPSPRNPSLISPPKEITSPLTLGSIQQHPASATNSDIAGGMNVDLLYVARQLADRISRLTPAEKPITLRRLQERSPELHDTVVGLMMSGANGPTAASAASARALPGQKPPQRGPEAALL